MVESKNVMCVEVGRSMCVVNMMCGGVNMKMCVVSGGFCDVCLFYVRCVALVCVDSPKVLNSGVSVFCGGCD